MRLAAAVLAALAVACGQRSPDPLPEAPPALPAAPAPGPSCGDPVNGLAIGLSLDRPEYGAKDRIRATLRARNAGDAAFTCCGFLEDWVYHVRFDSLDGGPAFLGGAGTFIEYDAPQNRVLAPGEEWTVTVGLEDEHRRYLREIPDRKPGDDWDYRPGLPPGRWSATVVFDRPPPAEGPADGPPWYRGRAVSNAVEIRVTE